MTARVLEAIEGHAFDCRPAECCGLLSGADGVITELHPLRNDAERPESRYWAAPADLLAATRRIRESGHRLLGIYHSHPRTPAFPSTADIEMAFYPESVYFIISLEPSVEMRAYRIRNSQVAGVDFVVVSDGASSAR